MKIDNEKIKELLERGVEEIVVKAHLKKRLESGEKLRVKFGIDPTSPYMHLGHTVPLRKLRQFQDLGHQAVLIIGDATAMIGDPTGREEARKKLSIKEIDQNKKTYLKQAGKILDLKDLEVHYNGEWFRDMTAADFLGLTSLVTVQQVLQREDFRKRLKDKEHPLSAIELTYPIMQGYDSVMVKSDLELGGVDQKLNLLMGRRLQRKFGQPEQDIMTVPLIEGTDGERKMSKSFGNSIELELSEEEMYAKLMSIPDELIIKYFVLFSDLELIEIKELEKELKKGMNPRDAKARLAWELTRIYHSKKKADDAEKVFDKQFRDREMPEDIPEYKISKKKMNIIDVLVDSKLVTSKSEARRLIDGGGIRLDGHAIEGYDVDVYPTDKGVVVQKGKRHFIRVCT